MARKKDNEKEWLLAIDLDGTIWDHLDISLVNPPYRKEREGVLINEEGERVRLNKDAIEFIKWARKNGAIVASLSWNKPDHVFRALDVFGISNLFDYHATEYTAEKDKRLLELIRSLNLKSIKIPSYRIVYIDDRDIHIDDIRRNVGDVLFIHIWKEVNDFSEAKKMIQEKLLDSQNQT
jgi:magnesium-dependent phosphatase-1